MSSKTNCYLRWRTWPSANGRYAKHFNWQGGTIIVSTIIVYFCVLTARWQRSQLWHRAHWLPGAQDQLPWVCPVWVLIWCMHISIDILWHTACKIKDRLHPCKIIWFISLEAGDAMPGDPAGVPLKLATTPVGSPQAPAELKTPSPRGLNDEWNSKFMSTSLHSCMVLLLFSWFMFQKAIWSCRYRPSGFHSPESGGAIRLWHLWPTDYCMHSILASHRWPGSSRSGTGNCGLGGTQASSAVSGKVDWNEESPRWVERVDIYETQCWKTGNAMQPCSSPYKPAMFLGYNIWTQCLSQKRSCQCVVHDICMHALLKVWTLLRPCQWSSQAGVGDNCKLRKRTNDHPTSFDHLSLARYCPEVIPSRRSSLSQWLNQSWTTRCLPARRKTFHHLSGLASFYWMPNRRG